MAASDSPTLLASEKTVASTGTAVALVSASQRVKSVTIIAKAANTNNIFVGGSDVDVNTNDGLAAGDTLEIPALNWLDLADIYIDATTNGEGVDFYAVKA